MVAKERQLYHHITLLCGRYYLRDCTAVAFENPTDHTKYKQPDALNQIRIFRLNFDEANHSFLHSFLLLEEIYF